MAALTLSKDQIEALPVNKGTCIAVSGTKLIAYKDASGALKVSDNTCVHFGAAFAPDVEDAGLMKCTLHQAKLNPATMTYTSPPAYLAGVGTKVTAGTAQPVYAVALNADGSATLTPPPPTAAGGGCCSLC